MDDCYIHLRKHPKAHLKVDRGIELKPQDILRNNHVTRWHIVDTVKTQSVAEHSFNVAVLAGFLAKKKGLPLQEVTWAALYHDVGEALTGDVPSHLKRVISYKDPIEDKLTYLGQKLQTEDPKIKEIIKMADLIDAVHFLDRYGIGIHTEQVMSEIAVLITDQDALELLGKLRSGDPSTLEKVI